MKDENDTTINLKETANPTSAAIPVHKTVLTPPVGGNDGDHNDEPSEKDKGNPKTKDKRNNLLIASMGVFLVCLAVAGGILGYQRVKSKEAEKTAKQSKKDDLTVNDPELITEEHLADDTATPTTNDKLAGLQSVLQSKCKKMKGDSGEPDDFSYTITAEDLPVKVQNVKFVTLDCKPSKDGTFNKAYVESTGTYQTDSTGFLMHVFNPGSRDEENDFNFAITGKEVYAKDTVHININVPSKYADVKPGESGEDVTYVATKELDAGNGEKVTARITMTAIPFSDARIPALYKQFDKGKDADGNNLVDHAAAENELFTKYFSSTTKLASPEKESFKRISDLMNSISYKK